MPDLYSFLLTAEVFFILTIILIIQYQRIFVALAYQCNRCRLSTPSVPFWEFQLLLVFGNDTCFYGYDMTVVVKPLRVETGNQERCYHVTNASISFT
jgi:hypothetical protein